MEDEVLVATPEPQVLTEANKRELIRLAQYFPWRIVWGVVIDGEFVCQANTTKRRMNSARRAGHTVYQLG